MIVLAENFNSMVSVFNSGMFEGKIMNKMILNPSLTNMFRSRLMNMQGYSYNVGALPYAPFLMKNGGNRFSGFEILQVDALASLLNFTYSIIEPPDGQRGRVGPDCLWTGLIGQTL